LRNNRFGGAEGWILKTRVRLPRDSRQLETAATTKEGPTAGDVQENRWPSVRITLPPTVDDSWPARQ